MQLELWQWDKSVHFFHIIQKREKRHPRNARSSENATGTKAFVKYKLLPAHQNTLRSCTVCGLKQIEFD